METSELGRWKRKKTMEEEEERDKRRKKTEDDGKGRRKCLKKLEKNWLFFFTFGG